MKKTVVVLVVLALAACKKTGDNQYEVVRPGLVTDTVNAPVVNSTKDTVNMPVVGTQKDTIIVNKPVIGTKKAEVKRPEVRKP